MVGLLSIPLAPPEREAACHHAFVVSSAASDGASLGELALMLGDEALVREWEARLEWAADARELWRWLDEYSREMGVSGSEIVSEALERLRIEVEGDVRPELRPGDDPALV